MDQKHIPTKSMIVVMIKKAKRTAKCVIKRILKFNDYKNGLFKNEIILKSQHRFKSEARNVYTEEISSNDAVIMIKCCKLLIESMLSKYFWC